MTADAAPAPRGWWVLGVLAGIVTLLGIGDVVGGATFEADGPVVMTGKTLDDLRAASPAAGDLLDFRARMGGVTFAGFGLLLLAIAAVPYRAGWRWAWVVLWILPAWAVLFTVMPLLVGLAPGQSLSGPMLSGVVIAVIAVLALIAGASRATLRGG